MSIVDALEKAKRLRKAQAAAEEAARPRRSSAARAVSSPVHDSGIMPAPRAREPQPIVRPVKPLQLQHVSYDVGTCSENRVLVPEVDPRVLKSAAASYRLLRTRILQRSRSSSWSILGITSAAPGEGKSVTALNLAISLAREGNQDVFLLDCDMRNPSICRYLGVQPPAQISDYFHGTAGVEQMLFGIGMERLAIAGGTTGTDSASELLANGRFETLIEDVRSLSVSPLILVDLPPVISTDDALVIAPRVDAMVLVAAEGLTRRDQLEKAAGLLVEYPIAGIILNRSAEALGSDYYGSKY